MSKRIYSTWKMECDTCKGTFTFTCWDYDVPRKCNCRGKLWPASVTHAPEPQEPETSARMTAKDADTILRDIGEIT